MPKHSGESFMASKFCVLAAAWHSNLSKKSRILLFVSSGISVFPSFLYRSHMSAAYSGSLGSPKSYSVNLSLGGRRVRSSLIALIILERYLLILRKHLFRVGWRSWLQWLYSLFDSPQFSIIDTHRSWVESGLLYCTSLPITFSCIPPTTCRMVPRFGTSLLRKARPQREYLWDKTSWII